VYGQVLNLRTAERTPVAANKQNNRGGAVQLGGSNGITIFIDGMEIR
jgi:hypothetical protein